MANEILPTTVGDLTISEQMADLYLLALTSGASVLMHPALAVATGRPGSDTVRVPLVGLSGGDLLTSRTPGSAIANTAITDDSYDVVIAPYAKAYNLDDMARFMSGDLLSEQAFAADASLSYQRTVVSKIATIGAGFTATVGSTGVDLTWADLVAAKGLLGVADATGAILAVLHPVQWADLEADALTIGGVARENSSMQGLIDQGLVEFKGRYMGIDIFVNSLVPTANAGADRAGCLVTYGAILIADTEYPPVRSEGVVSLGRAIFASRWDETTASHTYATHANLGVAMGIDAAGVSVISDA